MLQEKRLMSLHEKLKEFLQNKLAPATAKDQLTISREIIRI